MDRDDVKIFRYKFTINDDAVAVEFLGVREALRAIINHAGFTPAQKQDVMNKITAGGFRGGEAQGFNPTQVQRIVDAIWT